MNTRRVFVSIEILFSICDYFNQHSAIHYFHFVIISINTVSFHLFCYWTCVVHYIYQALIVQLCCSYQLKVQCLCLYVRVWQRMSSIINTSIRTYKKSNIIQDLYHSIFNFCYLSFCKIFCVFNTHSKVCIHYYVHSIRV